LLRWGGVGLGFALPPLVILAAEGARQGWLPVASLTSYSTETVLRDAVPAFSSMFVWPLLALMFAAQAFAADRSEGTEGFLLARPLRRATVWRARLSAALGTTVVVLLLHWLFWWLLMRLTGTSVGESGSVVLETSANELWRSLGSDHAAGVLLSSVAFLAGTAAGSLVRSPMQGILLGIALTLVPAGVAGFLGASFSAVRIGYFHLGWLFSALIVVGYLVSSYVVDCRGEPAGRGRLARGLITAALSVLAVPVLLVAAAPTVMRVDARWGLGNSWVAPSPDGTVAIVANHWQGAGWLVDTATAKLVRFLPPSVLATAWSPDGDRVAILHTAGALGGRTTTARVEFFDAAGERVGKAIDCPECDGGYRSYAAWSGNTLILRGGDRLVFVSVDSGERSVLDVGQPAHTWTPLGPTDEGRYFVYRAAWEDGRRPSDTEEGLLDEIDVERRALVPAFRIECGGQSWYARDALSGSGRYWIRLRSSETMERAVIDLETEEEHPFEGHAVWLGEDRLLTAARGSGGTEVRLREAEGERTLRSWPKANVMLNPSPDGRRVLVHVVHSDSNEQWIYDVLYDEWTAVPPEASRWVQWAGPTTLALAEPGRLALYDLEGESWRNVIGSAGP
jgi:hypothetical protein